jgi:hypothetical protein
MDYSEDDKKRIGLKLAAMLQLKRDSEHKDRFQTTWGTKTAIGVFETVLRLGCCIQDGTIEPVLNRNN